MPFKSPITQQKTTQIKHSKAKEFHQNLTPSEALLWSRLRASRLGGFHFRRQQVIEPYIVDFYCHSASLVVEVDGDIHAFQKGYDLECDQYLKELGYSVLRLTNDQIEKNLDGALEQILAFCKAASDRIDVG